MEWLRFAPRLPRDRLRRFTKQRIHAIVTQVIDELEHRRAPGRPTTLRRLRTVQRGGIAAWKALRDLLPHAITRTFCGRFRCCIAPLGYLMMMATSDLNIAPPNLVPSCCCQ
jgi:hypothetical protein